MIPDRVRANNKKERYSWIIVGVAVLVVMCAIGLARFGYTIILPRMKIALSLNNRQTGDIATANMIGYLVFSLLCGMLATKYGPRIVIFFSLLLTAAGLLSTGLAAGFTGVLVARMLAGAGGGGANVPVMGLIASWVPPSKRGLASGIAVSGSSFALLLSGLILPASMATGGSQGWRYGWYIIAGITAAVALLSVVLLKNHPPGHTAEGRAHREKTRFSRILKSKYIWIISVIYICFGFSYVIYATFYARYLTFEGGLSERFVGGLWSGIGAVSISSGFLWGLFSDKFGRKFALAGIFAMQAASFCLFSLWQKTPGYLISSLLFALTAWSIPAVVAAAIGDLLGPEIASAAYGFVTLLFGIGQASAPMIAGRIADATGSFALAFLLAAGVAVGGALLSLFFLPRKTQNQTESSG